jgi:pimeloyl-ACP methyl ester carboxylesterase
MEPKPLTITGAVRSYQLNFAKCNDSGIWDPGQFTRLVPASAISSKYPASRQNNTGIGAAMVGIHAPDPLPPFYPPDGIAAPVTAVVGFEKSKATLTLLDPVRVHAIEDKEPGGEIAADPMAALDWYRQESSRWNGLMGAIHGSRYMGDTGLYMLQPYDPQRIPLIFVHGLISTPQMWREVINGIESDPSLRGRYQYWVFRYPTGNPPGYSALRLREELKKIGDQHPDSPGYVLVGHSMGGVVSRMQAITVTRKSWDIIGRQKAETFFSIVECGSVGDRATTYQANPKVSRLIFICTPHRGSKMAIGTFGELCKRLIALPADVSGPLLGTAGNAIAIVSGAPGRLPNSLTGLSPESPTLKVVDSIPLKTPHHSIIGDRGRGDSPNSSDGVVEYWSSHMPGADSERIVPGPHGSHALPETIDELRRILHLHLRTSHTKHPRKP